MKLGKDYVWVLTAADMCIGPIRSGCKKCLMGWRMKHWPRGSEYLEAREAHCLASRRILGRSVSTTTWFDQSKITPAQAARVWNLGAALLGYTQGNPEAALARRMRP